MMQSMRSLILGEYSEENIKQMRAIHHHFIQDIGGDVPAILAMNDAFTKPKSTAAPHDFQLDRWTSLMGTSALRSLVENMVADICAYQKQRSERFAGKGDLNDPINLCCEAIKDWLARTLSHASCDKTTEGIIGRWVKFLKHLEDPKIFSPSRMHEATMLSLMVKIHQTLTKKIKPKIETEIISRSAREQLYNLVNYNEAVLRLGIRFLCCVLHDSKTPINCSIEHLQSQDKNFRKLLETRSGQQTQLLLDSQAFVQLFPLDTQTTAETGSAIVKQSTELSLSNPFYGKDTKPHLPLLFRPDKKPLCTTEEYLNFSNSGVIKAFRKNEIVISNFMELHGLLFELAQFCLICKQAYTLAGEGGDLLIYGAGNQHINGLLDIYKVLIQKLQEAFHVLTEIGDEHKHELTKRNKVRGAWYENYKQIDGIKQELDKYLKSCDETAAETKKQANSISLQQRIDKARDNTRIFVNQLQGFSCQAHELLGVPINPILMQTSSSHAALTSPVSSQQEEVTFLDFFTTDKDKKINDDNVDRVLDAMAIAPYVTDVELQKNGLTGSGAVKIFEALKLYPLVQKIELWQNNIGKEGAIALGELLGVHAGLTSVGINENGIGRDGAFGLANKLSMNKTLTFLDIGYNGICDAGATALCEVFAEHPAISNLRLGGNDITEEGGNNILKLASKNPNITDIEVYNNAIPEAMVTQIKDILRRNMEYKLRLLQEEQKKTSIQDVGKQSFFSKDPASDSAAKELDEKKEVTVTHIDDNSKLLKPDKEKHRKFSLGVKNKKKTPEKEKHMADKCRPSKRT